MKTDEASARRTGGIDAEAFARLAQRNHERLYAVAYAMTLDHDDARDLVQNTFERALRHLDDLRDPDRFEPWMVRILRNLAVDLRRERSRIEPVDPDALSGEPDATNGPLRLEREYDVGRCVGALLGGLTEDQRVVVSMNVGLIGNRIVTNKMVNNVWQVVTMNVDGSQERLLSRDRISDMEPVWSSDGRTIYFTSNDGRINANGELEYDVWAMDADGSNRRMLTDGVGHNAQPQPSPDGTRVLFESIRTGINKLYVMDRDGGNIGPLTLGTARDTNASWSPDGTHIVYQSAEDPQTLRIGTTSG